MKMIPFVLSALYFLSCQKEMLPIPPPPPPPVTPKLNVIWQVPITQDTSGEYTTSPACIVNGNIVFSTNYANPSAFVTMLDGEIGQRLWKFDDFISPIDGFIEYQDFKLNNKVVVNKWSDTHCINAITGQLEWALDVSGTGGGEPLATTIGEYIYKANYTGAKPKSRYESVVRAHFLQGSWDTLLTITAEDSFYLNIYPPTLWINPQGDSILIIRDNALRDVLATPYEGRYNLVNLYAWNMRTRQYEWQIKDFLNCPTISYHPPIIDGNRMYLMTQDKLHCLDLPTGNVVWTRVFPQYINGSGFVMHENFIIVQSVYDGMWAADKFSGHIRWFNPDTYGSTTFMSYFDGVVYFTSTGSSRLWAVNANTGKTIWNEFSPNALSARTPNAGFDFANVVIDPVRRVLYTADRYYMMCIKLPE